MDTAKQIHSLLNRELQLEIRAPKIGRYYQLIISSASMYLGDISEHRIRCVLEELREIAKNAYIELCREVFDNSELEEMLKLKSGYDVLEYDFLDFKYAFQTLNPSDKSNQTKVALGSKYGYFDIECYFICALGMLLKAETVDDESPLVYALNHPHSVQSISLMEAIEAVSVANWLLLKRKNTNVFSLNERELELKEEMIESLKKEMDLQLKISSDAGKQTPYKNLSSVLRDIAIHLWNEQQQNQEEITRIKKMCKFLQKLIKKHPERLKTTNNRTPSIGILKKYLKAPDLPLEVKEKIYKDGAYSIKEDEREKKNCKQWLKDSEKLLDMFPVKPLD